MKKILSVAAAIALAAALISCGDSSDEFSGAVDTVITVGTPKVTAKAYPGVNYISWEPIAQAKSYELYRTEDGANTGADLLSSGDSLSYEDVADAGASTIVDGKSYKYVVIAVGANNGANGIPDRAVYLKSSQGSATVTAKVPQSGTTALDLNKSYASKLNDKNVSKNVKAVFVEEGENAGKIYYEFPATAGYKYAIAFLADGVYESTGVTAVGTPSLGGKYLEDYKVEGTNTPVNPGKYNVYIAVDSVANALYPTSYVKTGVTVEVARLKFTTTNPNPVTISAKYTAEKTARIYWGPSKKTVDAYSDDYFPIENYKVYKSAENDIALTAVSATITEGVDASGNKIYYVDDTVEDNKVTYTYTIVLTDGVRYGASQTATLSRRVKTGKPTITTTGVQQFGTDGLVNDIKVVVSAGKDAAGNTSIKNDNDVEKAEKTVKLTYVILKEKVTSTAEAKFVDTGVVQGGYDKGTDTYTFYIENAAEGTYLFKAVASEAGYLDSDAVYGTTVVTTSGSKVVATRSELTAGDSGTLYGRVNTDSDSYDNYTFKLITVVTTKTTTAVGNMDDKVTVTSTTADKTVTASGLDYTVATDAAGTSSKTDYYLVQTRK